jgi:single-strand DNA-binding protein
MELRRSLKERMTTMISAVLTGNIGQDARVGDASGTPVVNMTVASRRFEKGNEHTDWVDVAFFGLRAQKISQYLTKGSRVAVRGTVHVREYTHNNEKRYALTMRADDIELLGGGEQKSAASDSSVGGGAKNANYAGPQADDLPF